LGKEIVTLEGLGHGENPHPVQTAFIDEQVFQCGYCLNGWVLTAKALLEKNPNPSDAEMRKAFETLVCRCGSHVRIFSAVRRASDAMKRRHSHGSQDTAVKKRVRQGRWRLAHRLQLD
jgi:nicotinate dehydrogenase subunit A